MIRRMLRAFPGAFAILGLLVAGAALMAGGLPKTFEAAYDSSLRDQLAAKAPNSTDLRATSQFAYGIAAAERGPGPEELGSLEKQIRERFPARLGALTGPGRYWAEGESTPIDVSLKGPQMSLAWNAEATGRVQYLSGTAPATVGGKAGSPRFDLAVSQATAEKLALRVGGTYRIAGDPSPYSVRITGIFRVNNPEDPFWRYQSRLERPSVTIDPASGDPIHLAQGLIADDGLEELAKGVYSPVAYQWLYEADPAAINAREAGGLADEIGILGDRLADLSLDIPHNVGLATGLADTLNAFLTKLRTAQAVLLLALTGLAGVGLGVVALAVQLIAERLHRGLAAMRARGASMWQVGALTGALGALISIPAAGLGTAAAWAFVPGPDLAVTWVLPLVLAVAATVLLAGRGIAEHRGVGGAPQTRGGRSDILSRPGPRRITVELFVVAAAAGGTYLLLQRGAGTQAAVLGADPLLIGVPALLTLATAVITMRVYPYPLRLAGRLLARRPAAVSFLGVMRASRSRVVATLPIVVLLPAAAMAVLGSTLATGLDSLQTERSWLATGADAVVRFPGGNDFVYIDPPEIERVRRLPDVTGVAKARIMSDVQPDSPKGAALSMGRVTLIAIDVPAYRALVADSPLTLPALTGKEALVTPALRKSMPDLDTVRFQGVEMKIDPKGNVNRALGLAPDRPAIVVPFTSLPPRLLGRANALYIGGSGVAKAALESGDATAFTRDARLQEIKSAPLAGAIEFAFRLTAYALIGYSVLAVLLALVLGAEERGRTVSYLRTLGLTARQARRLTAIEVVPVVALAGVAGLGMGLALPAAVGGGIDLSPYTGGLPARGFAIDPLLPVWLLGILAAVTVAGVAFHALLSSRTSLGNALRVGENRE